MECWKETSETGTGIRSNLLIKTEYKHDVPDFSLSFGSRNLPPMYAKVSYLI